MKKSTFSSFFVELGPLCIVGGLRQSAPLAPLLFLAVQITFFFKQSIYCQFYFIVTAQNLFFRSSFEEPPRHIDFFFLDKKKTLEVSFII